MRLLRYAIDVTLDGCATALRYEPKR
jgi:hypothetical protein